MINIGHKIKRFIEIVQEGGFKKALKIVWMRLKRSDQQSYETWFENHRADKRELEAQGKRNFSYRPKFSIIVPTYKTPEKFLREMIDSVLGQTYDNWELCVGDGSVEDAGVKKVLEEYARRDSRIKFKILDENLGISGNTNAALTLATGEYLALLDHDDLLAPEALYNVAECMNEDRTIDVIYTDEDKVSMDLKEHFQPHFKPDFSIDLLRSNNYICHMFVVKKSIADRVGGFRKEFDGSQDYDFIFRCCEQAKNIRHIPKILYYWRMHKNSVAENPESKMYAFEAGKRAIEGNLERCGLQGEVSHTKLLGFYKVTYKVEGTPKVSIVIPNKDEAETLKTCIDSILNRTSYPNYEIIIVENNSTTREIFEYYDELRKVDRVTMVEWKDEFNYSAINNYGIRYSQGEYVVLLNNDTEVITENWLEELLGVCQRKDVGIVGAKLLYPDDTIQHAGVIIGLGGIAGHALLGLDRLDPGYFAKTFISQNVSAVTAACLMVKRSVYDEVGGLEEQLKVAFNDIDFCLKVRQKGYLIVFDAAVELYHYESKTRGAEDTEEKKKRFDSEISYMEEKWRDILENGDPFYNPNWSLAPNQSYRLNYNL